MSQKFEDNPTIKINKKYINSLDSLVINESKKDLKILKKITPFCFPLSKISHTTRGLPLQKKLTKTETAYIVYRGKHISRYYLSDSQEYLPKSVVDSNKKAKELLMPKIISQRIVAHVTKPKDHIIIMSYADKKRVLSVDTVENTIMKNPSYEIELITGLFNSKFISWYCYRYIFAKAIRTMDFDDYYVGKIPIPKGIEKNKLSKKIIEKVSYLLKLSEKLGNKNEFSRDEIVKKIDREIDELVYKLYKLTPEEIKIVKSGFE